MQTRRIRYNKVIISDIILILNFAPHWWRIWREVLDRRLG